MAINIQQMGAAKKTWMQLSPSQQALLQMAWELGWHYGEPLPNRDSKKASMLRDMKAKDLLHPAHYQGEDCFNITELGQYVYTHSEKYYECCQRYKGYERQGT